MTRAGVQPPSVLFLDIDGVLCTAGSIMGPPTKADRMDPECVAQLRRVVEATGCALVLSSSWRFSRNPFTKVCESMRAAGWDDAPKCIGMTPMEAGPTGGIYVGVPRGKEIQWWLDAHPVVETYAIVDDDTDMLPEQTPFVVRTFFESGLTAAAADALIAILGANR